MPESEMSKRVTKAIKTIDKLVDHFMKDAMELAKALQELKERGKDEKK